MSLEIFPNKMRASPMGGRESEGSPSPANDLTVSELLRGAVSFEGSGVAPDRSFAWRFVLRFPRHPSDRKLDL